MPQSVDGQSIPRLDAPLHPTTEACDGCVAGSGIRATAGTRSSGPGTNPSMRCRRHDCGGRSSSPATAASSSSCCSGFSGWLWLNHRRRLECCCSALPWRDGGAFLSMTPKITRKGLHRVEPRRGSRVARRVRRFILSQRRYPRRTVCRARVPRCAFALTQRARGAEEPPGSFLAIVAPGCLRLRRLSRVLLMMRPRSYETDELPGRNQPRVADGHSDGDGPVHVDESSAEKRTEQGRLP